MRDLILSLFLLSVLIFAFSHAPREEQQKPDTKMYLVIDGEGAPMGEPIVAENAPVQPTEAPKPVADKLSPTEKPIDEVAWEVIRGDWGYMEARWQALNEAGYDAQKVQERVNEILEEHHP